MPHRDQSRSTVTLSLEPLAEDSPGTSPQTDPKPTAMVCPKCGYQAKSADDPLLTKFGGLGECPQCGIIPKKYLEIQDQPPHSAPSTPLLRKKKGQSIGRQPKERRGGKSGLLIIGITVVLAIGVFKLLKPKDAARVMVDEAKEMMAKFPYDIRGDWRGQFIHEYQFNQGDQRWYQAHPEYELKHPRASGYYANYEISLVVDEHYTVKEIDWTHKHSSGERFMVSWIAPASAEFVNERRQASNRQSDLEKPFVRYFMIQYDARTFSLDYVDPVISLNDPAISLNSVPIPETTLADQAANVFRYDAKEQAMRAEVNAALIPAGKLDVPLNSIGKWLVPPNVHSSQGNCFSRYLDEAAKTMKQPVNNFFEDIDCRFEIWPLTVQMTQAKLSVETMKPKSPFETQSIDETVYHLTPASTVQVSSNFAPTAEILFYKDGRKQVRIKDTVVVLGKPLQFQIDRR